MIEPTNFGLPPIIPPPPLPGMTEPAIAPRRGPWGFWSTAGWGAIIGSAYLGVQIFVTVVYVVAYGVVVHHGKSFPSAAAVAANGLVVSVAAILSVPVVVGLCLLFAKLRKGPSIREYLALRWPGLGSFVGWGLALVALSVVSDFLTVALGRPIVPEVMADIYRNTACKPMVWGAMVLAAPLAEEFFFRGFLFQGWSRSRLGGPGTVLLTAALWAMIHLQYDAYGIATVFVGGILVGMARLKTGSVLMCLFMHALMNLVATIQVAVFLPRN
jgi:uncharacterized protein